MLLQQNVYTKIRIIILYFHKNNDNRILKMCTQCVFILPCVSITNAGIIKDRLNTTDSLSIRFLSLLLSKYSLHFKYCSPS